MATFWDGQEAQSGIIQSYDWGQEAQVDWFEAVAKLEGDNCHADTVVTGMDGTLMWLKDGFRSELFRATSGARRLRSTGSKPWRNWRAIIATPTQWLPAWTAP